jgi:hypothetical protein
MNRTLIAGIAGLTIALGACGSGGSLVDHRSAPTFTPEVEPVSNGSGQSARAQRLVDYCEDQHPGLRAAAVMAVAQFPAGTLKEQVDIYGQREAINQIGNGFGFEDGREAAACVGVLVLDIEGIAIEDDIIDWLVG